MAKKMNVKEYARHVDAEPRTVRRWMKNGLLEYTKPKGHRARLIDSAQPRPKKKPKKKVVNPTGKTGQNIKPVTGIPQQADKRPPTVPRSVYERPGFVRAFEPSEPELHEPVEHESVLSGPVSGGSDDSDRWCSIEFDDNLVKLGLIVWVGVKLLPRILSQIR